MGTRRTFRWVRLAVVVALGAGGCLIAPLPAVADAPYPRPEVITPAHPVPSDPYDYEDYAWIDPGTGDCQSGVNPGDSVDGDRGLPENFDCKNDWKDTNYAAKPEDGPQEYDPTVTTNPAELGGVKGASTSLAWEVTTGRPDTVIAVMDSGIEWDGRDSVSGNLDQGEINHLNGLRKKFFLNAGELPQPGPAGCGSPGFGGYDRNCDGMFNVVDYQAGAGCASNCVTDVNNNTLIDPQDLILTYSDTEDDDNNGYPDDISGWDFFEDDNDANDDVDYGHGTGESTDSGYEAEAPNADGPGIRGDDGLCMNCMLLEMRVGDSFIADVNHFAEAVVYATDNGASVVQEALGTLNNTSFGQAAVDYAYENGVVIVASAADESAAHHNYPSNYNHTMIVNSVNRFNAQSGFPVQNPRSYLYLNGCTNFGGHIHVAIPSSSCSSDATGHASGHAGLLYSAARNAIDRGLMSGYVRDNGSVAPYPLSAQEAMQMFRAGAEDIDFSPPHSTTGYFTQHATPSRRFQSVNGWDMFFGYGRINVNDMLRGVGFVPKAQADPPEVRIPPEADIVSPDWFETLDTEGSVEIVGRVAANRVTSEGGTYDYVVEWAPGAQDSLADDDAGGPWTEAASGTDETGPIEGTLATLDMETVAAAVATYGPTVFDPATDPTSQRLPEKDAFRVRVRVTDSNGTVGVFQKQYFVHDDPQLMPGYPKDLGSDGAGSPAFADIDRDGVDELVISTGDGLIHAYKGSGGEAAGWPVETENIDLPSTGTNAYTTAGDGIDGDVRAPVLLGSPAIGDVVPGDGGAFEIGVADLEGNLYLFEHTGALVSGFPVSTDPALSEEPGCEEVGVTTPGTLPPCDDFLGNGTTGSYGGPLDQRDEMNSIDHGFNHNPVVADLDPTSAGLEILAGAGDNHVYAWRADGTQLPGWPVFLRDPSKVASVNPQTHKVTYKTMVVDGKTVSVAYPGSKVIVSPSVGDVDDDGDLEVVAAVNEEYKEEPNASRIREQLGDVLGEIADAGNGRVYILDHRGSSTPSGANATPAHPHEQAYLPGWPAKIAILSARILPYVGEGPDGAPTLADVDGNGDLEIGVATAVGPSYLLDHTGESHYGNGPDGRDITLATSQDEFKGDATDGPALTAVGGGSFGELLPGLVAYTAPTGGLQRVVDILFNSQQLHAEDHVSAWDTTTGTFMTGFPSVVNDLQFFDVPSMADVDGDGIPEVIEGTAVYDVVAANALERPVPGWPKFTGGWNLGSPALGDLDNDQRLDVAMVTREGWLYVWETDADACQGIEWPKYQHDLANTGNLEARKINPASCFSPPGGPPPEGPVAHSLDLTPAESSNEAESRSTFVAKVLDESGEPIEGAPVDWSEEGTGHFVSTEETTDENGEAEAVVTSPTRGNQSITASTTPCTPSGDCSDTSLQRWTPAGCDIFGTNGDDFLKGTRASETICGFGGDDEILGARGNDILLGGGGDDQLNGLRGDDGLWGARGIDVMLGSQGRDILFGKQRRDRGTGGPGKDLLVGHAGRDLLGGGRGDDTVRGSLHNDLLRGGRGSDRVNGGKGRDNCKAAPGRRDRERSCEI